MHTSHIYVLCICKKKNGNFLIVYSTRKKWMNWPVMQCLLLLIEQKNNKIDSGIPKILLI